ncbi:MAG: hypothetical protein O7G87_12155 [bacterium]|nr:hypothetical protein [bacterium]
MMMKEGFANLLLVLAVVCPVGAEEAWEIRADWSETRQVGEKFLKVWGGGTTFEDLADSIWIAADSARAWVDGDRCLFGPGVTLQVPSRKVYADTLEYYWQSKTAIFKGHVQSQEKTRRLAADKVIYDLEQDLLEIPGALVFDFLEEGFQLNATHMRYFALQDSGLIGQGAEVRKFPSNGEDTLVIRADSLVFTQHGDRLAFSESVLLTQGKMVAQADRVLFLRPDSLVLLEDHARISWIRYQGTLTDTVVALANRIRARMAAGEIREIEMYTDVQIDIFRSQEGKQTIRADTARVIWTGETVEGLEATGQVHLTLKDADGAETDLRGDRLAMAFKEGDLDSLLLRGNCSGIYVSEEGKTENRLSGGQQTIWFDSEKISRIQVEDNAECEQVPRDETENRIRVTGDRVVLQFEAGKLQEVVALGGVKGSYQSREEENLP